jgi:hypothetical protein
MPMALLGAAIAGTIAAGGAVATAWIGGTLAALTLGSVATSFAVAFAGTNVGRAGRVVA